MTNTSKELKNGQDIIEAGEIAIVNKEDLAPVSTSMFENVGQALFSTIKGDDRATKIKVYNAISDSENSLDDHKGEILEITDFVAHPITLQDEVTKEDVQAMRIVLLTKEGVGYHSVSQGVASSLQRVIGLVGQGPWTEEPLKIVPVEKKTRKGFKTLTLKLQG